eukprot:1102405-Pyramimonas_sp.AAC.1
MSPSLSRLGAAREICPCRPWERYGDWFREELPLSPSWQLLFGLIRLAPGPPPSRSGGSGGEDAKVGAPADVGRLEHTLE